MTFPGDERFRGCFTRRALKLLLPTVAMRTLALEKHNNTSAIDAYLSMLLKKITIKCL